MRFPTFVGSEFSPSMPSRILEADGKIRHDIQTSDPECDELELHLPSDTAEAQQIYVVALRPKEAS